MEGKITISDSDVLFLDESSGDIKISKDRLGADCQPGSTVLVKFTEDNDGTEHEFTVKTCDDKEAYLSWVKMHSPNLLMEGPISSLKDKLRQKISMPGEESDQQRAAAKQQQIDTKKQQRVDKNLRKVEKEQKKIDNSGDKAINRDIKEGITWNYFIQLPTKKYLKTPLQQRDVIAMYKDPVMRKNPAIVNAVVCDRFGSVIRRGKEDVDMKGININDSEAFKIQNAHDIDWTKENTAEFAAFLKSDAASDNLKAAYRKAATKKSKQTTKKANSKNSEQTPASGAEAQQGATTLITPAIMNKFNKFIKLTGMNVVDNDGRRLYNVDGMTPEATKNYWIIANGKEEELYKWLSTAVKEKILTESCSVRRLILEGTLLEAPMVHLDDADLMNPSNISFKDKIATSLDNDRKEQEEKARQEKKQAFKDAHKQNEDVEAFLMSLPENYDPENVLELIFEKLVPPQGQSDTVAGEHVRAMMRIMYRDYNDGDKFFSGYGIETCGSSAEYLRDHGLEDEIDVIIEDALRLIDSDTAYTEAIQKLCKQVIEYLRDNIDLLYEENTVDSREYSTEDITRLQPTFELEFSASPELVKLLDDSILNAWDLKSYVEDQLSYERVYHDAEVETPWSTYSPYVTVSGLTLDGYEQLKHAVSDIDEFWKDLVDEYTEDNEEEDEDNA